MNDFCSDEELREVSTETWSLQRRKGLILLIALCCIGFFIADVVTPLCFRDSFLALLCLGVVTAQLTVICVWGTLVRGTFLVRLPWTILLLVLSWCGFLWGISIESGSYGADSKIGIAVMWAFGFITSFVPLKMAALCFGWQIVQGSTIDHVKSNSSHYTIADLMFGTMLIAVSLGIVRVMLSSDDIHIFQAVRNSIFRDAEGWMVMSIYGVISLLVKLPCIWISLGENREKISFWIGTWIFYCLALAIMEIILLNLVFGSPGGDEVGKLYSGLIIGHQIMGAVMLIVCLALRGLGYRLERSLRRSSTLQNESVIEPEPNPLNTAG